jgi:hypothetical protein
MKRYLLSVLLFWTTSLTAGLPPTSSRVSGESTFPTTFKTNYGSFTGTRAGTTLTLSGIGAASGTSLVLGGTRAASAIFDAQSTTQGILTPRVTTAQMNAIAAPATGLTIYNTDLNSIATYNGTAWTYGFGNLSTGTDWVSYTPSIGTAFGTVSPASNQCKWKLIGADMLIKCSFAVGTPAAGTSFISIPSGYTIDASRLILQNTTSAPGDKVGFGQADGNGSNTNAFVTAPATSLTNFYHAGLTSSAPNLTPTTTLVGLYAPGAIFSTDQIRIPILGLSSNTSAWVQANSSPIATTTVFSARVDAAGVVSGENVDWINGNCTVSVPYSCTFQAGIFTTAPNCEFTHSGAAQRLTYLTDTMNSTTLAWYAQNDSGANTTGPTSIVCQKSSTDYTAAHSPFIIGTFAGTPNVPGYAGRVDTFSVSFGTTDLETICSSSPCFIDQIGTAVSSITRASAGQYSLNTVRTYTKLKCNVAYNNLSLEPVFYTNATNAYRCENCSSLNFGSQGRNGAQSDVLGTLICQGSY